MGTGTEARSDNGASLTRYGGQHLMLSDKLHALPVPLKNRVINEINSRDRATEGAEARNVLHAYVDGQSFVAKIDYYDRRSGEASANTSDAIEVVRVVTIMLESELHA